MAKLNPFFIELESKMQVAFFEEYRGTNIFIEQPGDREFMHILSMMNAMEQEIIHGHVAGSFVHAVCTEDYGRAIDNADSTNLKFMYVYRRYEIFLKDKKRFG